MFSKFTLLTLVPFAAALSVEPLINASSQGEVTVKWAVTSQDDPPVFTIELHNEAFNDEFAIANSVDASLEELTLTLPVVPDSVGYTIQLVDVGNIDNIYAESAQFGVGLVQTDSTSSTGTESSTSGTRSSTSTTTRPTTSLPPPTPTTSATPTSTAEGSTFNGASPMRYSMTGALLAAVAGVAAVAL